MRELIVDVESSTAESLFLRDQDGHEYRLAVTDELRALIARGLHQQDQQDRQAPQGEEDAEPSTITVDADTVTGTDTDAEAFASASAEEEVTLTPVSTLKSVPDVPEDHDQPDQPAEPEESGAAGKSDEPDEGESPRAEKPRRGSVSPDLARERERALPKPDPLFSNPLTMRPRDIQERIRAGSSTQELADEMKVAYTRVEPYAHPVMLERVRMAEIAKKSHPVRDDGPAKLTLWEVLATSFGSRGHSLAEATWDAYKEAGNAWVVRISWRAGLSENTAEWVLRNHHSSSPTAEARDAVAADLTDPNFMQPVRSLSPISRGERYEEDDLAEVTRFDDDLDTMGADDSVTEDDAAELEAVQDGSADESTADTAETAAGPEGEEPAQAAEPQAKPVNRRRKSVTPHWEDVLLGVRSNTKRPRS